VSNAYSWIVMGCSPVKSFKNKYAFEKCHF